MRTIRFGLVGFGALGSHHARDISEVPGAELVDVAAHTDASRGRAMAGYHASTVYADHRVMLAHERLDVVDVVQPSDVHYAVAKDVLTAGRHLLLEKPVALLPLDGISNVGIHAGYAVYFPELFPDHLRATGSGVCFNGGRLLASPVMWLSAELKAWTNLRLVESLLSLLFLLGLVLLWFLPETKGRPLPSSEVTS
jgi:hypothetical protein